jgi:hypothetical protein
LGKESQLTAGSPYLTLQAAFGQCGFEIGTLDDCRGCRFDGRGDLT